MQGARHGAPEGRHRADLRNDPGHWLWLLRHGRAWPQSQGGNQEKRRVRGIGKKPIRVLAVCSLFAGPAVAQDAVRLEEDIRTTPIARNGNPGGWTALGSRILFSATTELEGSEPWVQEADGSVSLLLDVNPGPDGSSGPSF